MLFSHIGTDLSRDRFSENSKVRIAIKANMEFNMTRILIIAIVVFSAAYILIRGIYKRDETSKDQSRIGLGESGVSEKDQSRIGWGESGESGSDGGSDE